MGTDQSAYNTGILTTTTTYRVYVSADESGCEDIYSEEVIVTVLPDLLITAQPNPVSECIGGTDQMFVTITGGSGVTSYQWQESPDGTPGSFTNVFVVDPVPIALAHGSAPVVLDCHW